MRDSNHWPHDCANGPEDVVELDLGLRRVFFDPHGDLGEFYSSIGMRTGNSEVRMADLRCPTGAS